MKYNLIDTYTSVIVQKDIELDERLAQKLNYAYAMNYSKLRWHPLNDDSDTSTQEDNTTS